MPLRVDTLAPSTGSLLLLRDYITSDFVLAAASVSIVALVAAACYSVLTSRSSRRRSSKRSAKNKKLKKPLGSLLEDSLDADPLNPASQHNPTAKTMSVVGIDFGNLSTVVAVARNRGIDVITNETSNRATPSLVSFGERQRFLGEGAKTQEISNFKNTVCSLKRMIGRPHSDPEIMGREKRHINANVVEGESGETAAAVMFQNEHQIFSFAQLAAMFLVKVKEFTSAEIKGPVNDCVISCPTWFSDAQRRALAQAAEVAGLHCLRLMNDTTAAALGYGITKTDLPDPADPKTKPRIVVFADLGHSSYQVAVVSLVKGKLIIKGTAWDRNLGGRDFDDAIVNHFIKEFDAKYKLDIASSAKAVFRLRQAAERSKKILSANPFTMLNVESLLDDKDVSGTIKRAEFEEWVAPLVQRLTGPLEEALRAAGVTPDEVDFVELVGGSTRVPIVKETLAKFFGGSLDGSNKLATTLNQDEAVARGCALQCAILSPVFKVRDFSTQEWNGYPIELSWDVAQAPAPKSGEPATSSMEAFSLGNPIPSSKILTFVRALRPDELAAGNGSVDLVLDASYGAVALARDFPTGLGANIGSWTIKGIKHYPSTDVKDEAGNVVSSKATIKVKTKLDANGILVLEAANQIEELVVPVEEEAKPEDAAATPEAKDAAASQAAPTTPPATTEEGKDAAPKTKKVVKRHDLTIVAHTHAASRDQITKWIAAEGEMYASDRLVIDTAEKRNSLEEYVYEVRSKLEMAWSDFVADEDRAAFSKQLNATEDWLYGEGEDATKSVYVEKLNELKKVGDPIAKRYIEAEERPQAEKAFREYVNSVVIGLQAEDDRYAHIAKEDLERVSKECHAKLDWLNAAIAKQNELPKHAPLHVTVDAINKEKDLLRFTVTPILSKPKPAPKKEEPKKEEPAPAAADSTPAPEEPMTDAAPEIEEVKPANPAEEMDID
ncbi:adenyl-nucleotide exchange factor sse1 [Polyrhizophydium stewartii]|uniref:Adenyl-nucleotide exchange factor sse1 n=1 Tax=Polyrhizophydium stewartii TaxID=2732419 RepID=A0ABR4N750_9FUNG